MISSGCVWRKNVIGRVFSGLHTQVHQRFMLNSRVMEAQGHFWQNWIELSV